MERIRQSMMNDARLYPDLANVQPRASSSRVPDINNIFDEPSPPASPNSRARNSSATIILSDSDEDEDGSETPTEGSDDEVEIIEAPKPLTERNRPTKPKPKDPYQGLFIPKKPVAKSATVVANQPQRQSTQPIQQFTTQPTLPSWGASRPTPIGVPRNPPPAPRPPPPVDDDNEEERLNVPDFRNEVEGFVSSEDADKALRDLMGGAIAEDTVIDENDAVVPGFKDGFKLLPHQIQGRHWMKAREDVKLKRYGGILADDMGLGKTIQTIVRIVEGKAQKSDRADGWSGSTLVVVPLAVMHQWVEEAQRMTDLKVTSHHGDKRTGDPSTLRKFHIVVTTYDVVKSEFAAFRPELKNESKQSKLKVANKNDSNSEGEGFGRSLKTTTTKRATMQVDWWRVVLDEAHNIKNRNTKAAQACFELKSRFRWCLTGTPMQNDVIELYSLLKFLHVKPYSDFERFNSEIGKPVKSGRGINRAMKKLHVVLKAIMLRRLKDQMIDGQALIDLPPCHLDIVSCTFSPVEQAFYDELAAKMDSTLKTLMEAESNQTYISVLLLVLRLRQACDHCVLVSKDFKDDSEAIEPKAAKSIETADGDDLVAAFGQLNVTRKCQLCTSPLNSANSADGSWDTYCEDCARLAKQSSQLTSTKIRKIVEILEMVKEESKGEDKTIIFSQFTTMLDLIEPLLIQHGIRFARYDGKMKPAEREESLKKIKNDPKTTVILISFRAGSTGLNLTACNRVILVDMWWNPALETQAFDRANRMGQTKAVKIYKLKVDGTVEDRILALQEKKRELTKAALSGDKAKNLRLNMNELLALFDRGGNDDDDDD